MSQLTERVAELYRRAERQVPSVASHSVLVFGAKTWNQAHAEGLIIPAATAHGWATFRPSGQRCVVVGPREVAVDSLSLRFEVHE